MGPNESWFRWFGLTWDNNVWKDVLGQGHYNLTKISLESFEKYLIFSEVQDRSFCVRIQLAVARDV